ncbi:LPS biosynthesis protein WbpP [Candidatus Desantisbacteria bacterium CG1_02_38_46]|uniref:LPS biosynthesis protein WbpP n=3 Tax=unclassified Candidatus Desantisiibacteriota TaxID=3106372 RepID=A0A2H9PDV5_9BACT|nr:MAG: LPS biosynthesis protein WbpP [Candidatus Desantisbacteria bacterium CG1_02_38_46]PIU50791.1 MAG: LPS biosynthesis protein WbpP [Candidatus Desantisbacteria bacterium CG07_land_8_20_14_0_80_39_15]PIZ17054.1 MAG: LPS biosynthesis protein WbpP [Candidatus Desantisbacteria bacterium CG_4_10_14_0_8_um_filter_39_17]
MRVLVTGGAGFIGSHIVEELVRRGDEVRVLDNFATGKRENIAAVLDKIELIEGDLRNMEAVNKAVYGVEYVLHQGAIPSVPRSIADPITTNEVNAVGTLNVLVAARDASVKRVVYASSSSVYGEAKTRIKKENMAPNPLSPYALSKLTGEYYSRIFYSIYGLETIILRYFNVFGPRQDPLSQYSAAIPKFITLMIQGKQPTIFGDGRQTRDFTYVQNVVQANLSSLVAPGAAGQVCNIACGRKIELNRVIELLNKTLEVKILPVYTSPRSGDIKYSLADISNAKKFLGYNPKISFEEGLKKTVEYFRRLDVE